MLCCSNAGKSKHFELAQTGKVIGTNRSRRGTSIPASGFPNRRFDNCFVSITSLSVAPQALICSLLLSKCSARIPVVPRLIPRQSTPDCQNHAVNPHRFQSTQGRLSVLIRRSARNFRVTRHPTGIADSTLPSLWSNADFRRANIALSDGGSITPCLAEVLRLSKL